ncbi:MAG TPA: HEPN domain-containing protein [Thermoplasmata archaeon]|nr:HEPN domain-containing protein [Thermoplasmata archaeon]
MTRTKEELIKSWLKKAEKDLLTAKHELSFADAVTESICFHNQQAAEKYLKAYLVFLGIPFTKTHEIGELVTKCENKDREISALKEEADKLTDYAIVIRYPEEWIEPTLEEAREAFELANKIREFVLNRITFANERK